MNRNDLNNYKIIREEYNNTGSGFVVIEDNNTRSGISIFVKCGWCGEYFKTKNHTKTINNIKNGKFGGHRSCLCRYNSKKNCEPGNCVRCGKFNNHRSPSGIGRDCGCLSKHLNNNTKLNTMSGKCSICGKYNCKRDAAGRGIECKCASINNSGAGFCICCKKYVNNRNVAGYGVECGCCNKINKENCKIRMSKGNCTICGKFVNNRNMAGLCKECADRSGSGICVLCHKTVQKRNNCGICFNCAKPFSLKGTEHKFCKKCNKITPHVMNRCRFCDPWEVGFLPNFTERDNILYYKNQEWESYKSKFKIQNIQTDFDKYNGFWQNTYRLNNINSSGQDAMEKELVEKGIGWFAYIKFYIDKNKQIKPLVVGKSGSKLVNLHSDIKFDYLKENDKRAARKFLHDEKLKWFTKQVYIIPCKSEKEALEIESQIQKENPMLFGG